MFLSFNIIFVLNMNYYVKKNYVENKLVCFQLVKQFDLFVIVIYLFYFNKIILCQFIFNNKNIELIKVKYRRNDDELLYLKVEYFICRKYGIYE